MQSQTSWWHDQDGEYYNSTILCSIHKQFSMVTISCNITFVFGGQQFPFVQALVRSRTLQRLKTTMSDDRSVLFLFSKAIPADHRMLVPGLVQIHPRSLSVAENHRDASDGTTFSFYLRCRSHHSPVLSSVNVVVERPEGVVRAERPVQYQIVWPWFTIWFASL